MQDHNPTLKRSLVALCFGALVATAPLSLAITPDTIVLTSGKVLRGLIVKQTSKDVTLQTSSGEKTISNKDIVRIQNVSDETLSYTEVLTPGSLPPWRIMANDLRNMDEIKKLRQIPATAIDNGVFKNVPYKSFRANDVIELNIYGDPDDPAAVEVGIYGPLAYLPERRRLLRAFLGSYLSGVDEIRALYSLDIKKDGKREVNPITIEITQPDALDAYGAWWLSFYNEKKLNQIRLSDAAYRRMTLPMDDVVDRKGFVKMLEWQMQKFLKIPTSSHESRSSRVFSEGFYRDEEGNFHLNESPEASPTARN